MEGLQLPDKSARKILAIYWGVRTALQLKRDHEIRTIASRAISEVRWRAQKTIVTFDCQWWLPFESVLKILQR